MIDYYLLIMINFLCFIHTKFAYNNNRKKNGRMENFIVNIDNKNLYSIGMGIPKILIPNKSIDYSKWSVVACDQYTSQLDYWKKTEEIVENCPSTLKMVLPEVYLEEENWMDRIFYINQTMNNYLISNFFMKEYEGFILVDRSTSQVKSRKGLIVMLDLEKYDYRKNSATLIRATEGTVEDRLPPRIKIRENAPLELPHIMVLIDDPDLTVIEPLFENLQNYDKLYDFELMQNGGHLKGYGISNQTQISSIIDAITRLSIPETFVQKYGTSDKKGHLLFAVGDGNHSLASAKGHWENLKSSLSAEKIENHPARYALVELVNVHDHGLIFEPIHRVLFNASIKSIFEVSEKYNKQSKTFLKIEKYMTKHESDTRINDLKNDKSLHIIPFEFALGFGIFIFENPSTNLPVASLQNFLDFYLSFYKSSKIDYIHGGETTRELGTQEGNIGFFLPSISKYELFKTVILDNVLPRKTFSMGEAEEKRFYLECRQIKE
jgi:hypothetical protein